jgi:prepilin-type N-terminal cleavage/methylation domain-containing protein
MKAHPQSGFTLYELLITLLVAGVLFGLGVPNFLEFQRNGAMSAAANEMITGLLAARAEAVKRQVFVTWCLSANATAAAPACSPAPVGNVADRGFIVWVDDNGNVDGNGAPLLNDASDGNAATDAAELAIPGNLIRQSAAPGGTMRVSSSCSYLSFGPNGFPRTAPGLCAPGNNMRILLCDDRGNRAGAGGQISTARVIRIDNTGRGQVLQDLVDTTAAVAALGAGAGCP